MAYNEQDPHRHERPFNWELLRLRRGTYTPLSPLSHALPTLRWPDHRLATHHIPPTHISGKALPELTSPFPCSYIRTSQHELPARTTTGCHLHPRGPRRFLHARGHLSLSSAVRGNPFSLAAPCIRPFRGRKHSPYSVWLSC